MSEIFEYEKKVKMTLQLDISELPEKTIWFSENVAVGGLSWKLKASYTCGENTGNIPHLGLFVFCETPVHHPRWWAKASGNFTLHSTIEEATLSKTYSRPLSMMTFSTPETGWGCLTFMKWDQMTDTGNGYLNEGMLTISAEMSIHQCSGVHRRRVCNFDSKRAETADMVLLVEGKKIAVSSQLLALHSPFFHQMFFGPLAKKEEEDEEEKIEDGTKAEERKENKKAEDEKGNTSEKDVDHEINDVSYDNFVLLLKTVYPEERPVCVESCEPLLQLADQLDFPGVTQRCDEFLARFNNNSVITVSRKIIIADRFNLPNVLMRLPTVLRTKESVKSIVRSREYKEMPDSAKILILEQLEKLV